MNWYKKEKYSSLDWNSILKWFSGTVLLGAATLLALNNIDELKNKFYQDPNSVINAIQQSESKISSPEPIVNNVDNYISDAKNMVIRHEGKRNKIYFDTKNIPTIGIGFNLQREDAKEKIEQFGLNFSNILSGKELLSDEQINILFEENFNEAIERANSFLPDFEQYPSEIKSIIVDMAFNLGNKLFDFVNFRTALINKDYENASKEMINSKWYGQVGNRSKELVNMVKNIKGD